MTAALQGADSALEVYFGSSSLEHLVGSPRSSFRNVFEPTFKGQRLLYR